MAAAASSSNSTQSHSVPCPSRGLFDEQNKVKDRAYNIFSSLCPPSVQILDVYPNLARDSFNCSWTVEYAIRSRQETNQTILREIDTCKPDDTEIYLKVFSQNPPCWSIEYGILPCTCEKIYFIEPDSDEDDTIDRNGSYHKSLDVLDFNSFKLEDSK